MTPSHDQDLSHEESKFTTQRNIKNIQDKINDLNLEFTYCTTRIKGINEELEYMKK